MILYYLYEIFIALPIFLVLTLITALVTIVGCLVGSPHFWGYYPGKAWSRMTCILALLPVKVVGREKIQKHQSYVFVANHQGAFDIFLIYGYLNRNFKWMMKKGLRNIPFVGKACEEGGHVFVDRSSPTRIKECIRKAEASLVDGVSLVVFPEGSRSFTGKMGYFKRGAFVLANDLQLPVVPITINGSFDVLPRFRYLVRWHPLSMTIHDPIPPQGRDAENIRHTMDLAYQKIQSALPDDLKGMVVNPDQEVP